MPSIRYGSSRVLLLILSLASISACDTSNQKGEIFQYQSRLQAFDNCSDLKSYLLQTAAQEQQLQQYVWEMPLIGSVQNDGVFVNDSAAGAVDTAQPESSIVDYSGTNNQVSGVDEADFIKTDGEYTYLLSGGYFLILDTWPAEQSEELARVELEGYPVDLFIDQDTAWVVSHAYQTAPWQTTTGFAPRVNYLTQVSLFDISNRSSPQLLRRVSVEAGYVNARLIDHRVHMVVSSYLDLYSLLDESQPVEIEDMLPTLLDQSPTDELTNVTPQLISDCASVYHPLTANGTGTISLLTFDLSDPMAEISRQTLVSNSGEIYANTEHLYIASREDMYWAWLPVMEGDDQPRPGTTIHKFAIEGAPRYLASGRVEGYLLNQFSMDEYQGLLRVATTDNAWWSDDPPKNRLFILQQSDTELETRSVLSGLGKPGETIFAVRFIEERGFVVTFQQIDPLYSLDLSDPDHPLIAGELEVPGFSTYLHPIDDNLLLAIGRDETNSSIKLSLFDLSLMSEPQLLQEQVIGSGSYSEAEYNHKAFTWYARENLLALPMTRWSGDFFTSDYASYSLFNGLQVYRVDPVGGFSLLGEVDHSEFYRNDTEQFWYYPDSIRRSFFVSDSDQQSYLYSLSSRGFKVNAIEDFNSDLAGLLLPVEEYEYGLLD